MPEQVCVVGAGAVSPQGFDLVSLEDSRCEFRIPHIPPQRDAGDRRTRKLMSRGAQLAAIAIRQTLNDSTWADADQVGLFMGVGSSSASMSDLISVLRTSFQDGELSMSLLGSKGLRSFNPLHTFMLLPNFSMCHSALIEGITGPNGVYFSRGSGTITALMEAKYSVESAGCSRALCGGADSALHPLSEAELTREGYIGKGLAPSEGAGILALTMSSDAENDILVETVAIHSARKQGLASAATKATQAIPDVSRCLIMPWGDNAREALFAAASGTWPEANITDISILLGESLAASPAVAWTAAIAKLRIQPGRIAVLSAGIDGDVGIVIFSRGMQS